MVFSDDFLHFLKIKKKLSNSPILSVALTNDLNVHDVICQKRSHLKNKYLKIQIPYNLESWPSISLQSFSENFVNLNTRNVENKS